ncbi:hypothetical protein JCM8208_006090 [Rhodotorula glutinis]
MSHAASSPVDSKLKPEPARPPVHSPLSHATASQPTPAASLPTELLLRIFELMPMMYAGEVREDLVAWTVSSTCPDLPKVARVCRGWRRAAQLSLFHSVSLVRRKQVDGFIETVTSRPDLAQRVTALHIGLIRGTPEHSSPYARQVDLSDRLTEALALCVNVRHLVVNQMRLGTKYRFVDVLERLPLVSLLLKLYDPGTEDGLDTGIFTVPSDVYRAFSLPELRNFELNFRPTWARHSNYLVPVVESHVENMSVTVNAPRGLTPMLSAAGANLVRLNIYTEHVLDPDAAIAAFSTLVNLREFRLESTVASQTPRLPAVAALAGGGGRTNGPGPSAAGAGDRNDWLEALLPLYTKLQRLSISEQAASAGFLRLLAPSVEVAEYISWDARPDSVLEQLEAVLRGPAPPGVGLRLPGLVVLAVDEEAFEGTVDDDKLAQVTDAFRTKGTEFRVAFEPMEIPGLRWVDM